MSRPPEEHTPAVLDHGRLDRIGLSEAVLCRYKTPEQIAVILDRFHDQAASCLLTQLQPAKRAALPEGAPVLDYDPVSRTAFSPGPLYPLGGPAVAIVSGGTSDAPVCLEAARTLAFHGIPSALYQDVGVAGLWRLTERVEAIRSHPVVIVVAGMEGALFSVLGGLVAAPVIAVPTSIGYGVAAGGRVALESALSSCASGLAVVNIDNGYGAACAAIRMLGRSDHGSVGITHP